MSTYFQWLTIKQDGLAMLTRDECWACGMAINCFKQALYLAVIAAEYYDVVGIGDVGHMDISSNLNPWVVLQSLAENPVNYVIEEGRGESTSLSKAGADLKRH